jgi:hypothetical protein
LEHAASKAVICVRMRDSGHALATEEVQRLVRVDVTSDDEGVGPPGAKAAVTFVNVERQLARVESVLSAFKNVVQDGLIPEGMRGFAVVWANAADVSSEVSANSLNIVV